MLFIESLRELPGHEFADELRFTVAHEVGHLLGGSHSDLGVMSGGRDPDNSSQHLTGASLLKFMLLQEGGPGEGH